jgi:Fic family protein
MNTSHRHPIYIWQQPEWPHFTWHSELLLEPLSRLSLLQGQLSGKMSMLAHADKSEVNLQALTNELLNTSDIEGVTLNTNSVRSSIARRLGIEIDGTLTEDHYVDGLVDVMLDAIHNADKPLSAERLFDWHCALFPLGRSGMHKITVGNWRTGNEPMQVVSGALGHEKVHYEAPASDDVAEEMAQFITWFNETDVSPIIKAAIAHLRFVTIHPFDDGNGRISRTIADMCLAKIEAPDARYYSMSAEINSNKKSYYDILEHTQKGDLDITKWILWFIECLENAINRAYEIVKVTLEKALFWDRLKDVSLNERQRKIINMLWSGFEGKLTSSKWAKICRCSPDTALRDINDLIAKSILCDTGENGRSKNYALIRPTHKQI